MCTCVCVRLCAHPSMYHYETQCVMGQGNTSSLIVTLLVILRLGKNTRLIFIRNTHTHTQLLTLTHITHTYTLQLAFTHSYSFFLCALEWCGSKRQMCYLVHSCQHHASFLAQIVFPEIHQLLINYNSAGCECSVATNLHTPQNISLKSFVVFE